MKQKLAKSVFYLETVYIRKFENNKWHFTMETIN